MYQVLILITVITLVYLIARSARKPKANISEKSSEMVKCKNCDLNIPKSEAIQSGENWFCSEAHKD
ncbi:MAG: PP0621 family protein [Gammaproteobacteria bacterium]